MDLSTVFQLFPYAGRINKAMQTLERLEKDPDVQAAMKAPLTIQRLEKDPDVQDAIALVQELTALIVKSQTPEQHG